MFRRVRAQEAWRSSADELRVAGHDRQGVAEHLEIAEVAADDSDRSFDALLERFTRD